jgi:Ca2+/Na+ antiporter
MENLFFKKMYLNFAAGILLIAIAVVGYFTEWFEDFLPYFFAGVLLLVSANRFIFQFKKIISKNATLILVIEFVLDLIAIGLLVYLRSNISIFIGVVVYLRGVAYLLINYIATRKIKLMQYIINILFVTLGAFLMFSTLLNDETLVYLLMIVLIFFGLVYVLYGVFAFRKSAEKTRIAKEKLKKQEKVEKLEEKKQDKIEDMEVKIEKAKKEATKEILTKEEAKKPKAGSLESMTIPELKKLGAEKGLTGLSNLNKDEIIKKIKEVK